MRDIATEDKGSSLYVQTEQKIRYGLEFNTMHGTIGTEAIKHFRKFSNRYGVRRPVFADIAGGLKATSDEYSTKVKMLVHKVLSKHAKCQCYDQTGDTLKHRQISRLLLKVAPSYEPEDHAEFEMLFSLISDSDKEASDWSCTGQCLWQDVQVLVPRYVSILPDVSKVIHATFKLTNRLKREKGIIPRSGAAGINSKSSRKSKRGGILRSDKSE